MAKQRELIFLVDWLQFTLHRTELPHVFDLIGIPEQDFMDMPTGRYSYAARKTCGSISVMYGGREGMGIHVEFEGQGCRQYETYYDVPWEVLFERIAHERGDYSRLDLAIDELRYDGQDPYWTVKKLIRKSKDGATRSKFKTAHRIEKIKLGDGSSAGDTIYFGSAQSDIQFRAYQKDLERLGAGYDLVEGLSCWNRFEVQLRDNRAAAAARSVLEGRTADHLINGIIRNYLSFCLKTEDSNKSRWPICDWWLDYLGDAEKLRLAEKAPDKTIERKKEWIDKQVLPTLAEIWVAEGKPGEDWFADLLTDGMDRMTEQQWDRAEMYRARWTQEQSVRFEQRKERREEQRALFEKRMVRYRQGLEDKRRAESDRKLQRSLDKRMDALGMKKEPLATAPTDKSL
ncbi:replication initiation factor domain-containing protein [Cohnella sp. GCM10020058]|uniref:replication initiation factor domain-containing protein n=1 Tax=Cohnella sp. GCM10020058 TaxID=3317330 RepID=UPI003645D8F2